MEIEKALERRDFGSQDELREFVGSVQRLIRKHEQHLYEVDEFTAAEQNRIREWRNRLHQIFQECRGIPEKSEHSDELEKTARVAHRQVRKADANQQVLDKSTLKLMGLNYTNGDIEKALQDARKRIRENKQREKTEVFLIFAAFGIFASICLLVLFDKFVSAR